MLILTSPIVLQSISPITAYSDWLGAKLIGNYQVIGTNITAEDLIYMTMQAPEIYAVMENRGTLAVENNFNSDNQVKLELVNQLINRIMLYNSEQFTYQDEVFTASILHKLGINDVNEFMQHIKMHMDRNRLLTELIDKYFEYGSDIFKTVNELMQNTKYEWPKTAHKAVMNQYNGDLYIQNEIYERLETAECSNTIYDYGNSVRTEESVLNSIYEAVWIEQADAIHLSQMRQSLYHQTSPSIWQEYLKYEVTPLELHELSESSITKRICAAILENIIQKLSYEEMQNQYDNKNIRKNYIGILHGSAADVIERFKIYQSYEALGGNEIAVYNEGMARLHKDEMQLADLLYLTDIYETSQENEDLNFEIKRNILLSVWENQNLQKQLTENIHIYERESVQDIINNISRLRQSGENYLLLRQQENNRYLSIDENNISETTDYLTEIYNYVHNAVVSGQKIQSDNQNIFINIDNTSVEEPPAIQNGQRNYLIDFFNRYSGIEFDPDVPIMQNIELLERINQHNMDMKQKFDSISIEHNNATKRIVVDKTKAMRNALRALENPDKLRQEIYENSTAIPRQLPEEIERILSIADENTQNFYRWLLGYDNEEYSDVNIENGAIEQITQLNQEQFSEIINNINSEIDITDITHIPNNAAGGNTSSLTLDRTYYQELQNKIYMLLHRIESQERGFRLKEDYIENIQKRTEVLVRSTGSETCRQNLLNSSLNNIMSLEHISISKSSSDTVAELLHTTRENISEELADEIAENIEKDTNIKINKSAFEHINEDYVTEKQLQKIKDELIRQSEEKITQIVNQNLRTQVHTISDLVYLELEKRLKNEQRRRGY